MLLRDVGELPTALSTAQLSDLTGVDQRIWWQIARAEIEPPFEISPLRLGGRMLRWPTAPVLRALGLDVPGRNGTAGPETTQDDNEALDQ